LKASLRFISDTKDPLHDDKNYQTIINQTFLFWAYIFFLFRIRDFMLNDREGEIGAIEA